MAHTFHVESGAARLAGEQDGEGGAVGRLGELVQPAPVLRRNLDFPHVAECCRELVRALPAARSRVLRGIAHLPSLERPVATTELQNDLLSDP